MLLPAPPDAGHAEIGTASDRVGQDGTRGVFHRGGSGGAAGAGAVRRRSSCTHGACAPTGSTGRTGWCSTSIRRRGWPWPKVVGAARDLRERLKELGLDQLRPHHRRQGPARRGADRAPYGWPAAKRFAAALARAMAADSPGLYTAKLAKAARSGRIFIDYLRNENGASAIASYSLRARRGATVATPIDWAEVDELWIPGLVHHGHGPRPGSRPAQIPGPGLQSCISICPPAPARLGLGLATPRPLPKRDRTPLSPVDYIRG